MKNEKIDTEAFAKAVVSVILDFVKDSEEEGEESHGDTN